MHASRLAGTFVLVASVALGHVASATPADAPGANEKKAKDEKDEKQQEKDLRIAQNAREQGRKLGKVVSAIAAKPGTPKEEVERARTLLADNDLHTSGDVLLLAVVLAHSKVVPGGTSNSIAKQIEEIDAAIRALEHDVAKLDAMLAQMDAVMAAMLAELGSDNSGRSLCERLDSATDGVTTAKNILDRLDPDARWALLHALGIHP